MPSRRRQISLTAGAFSAVRVKPGPGQGGPVPQNSRTASARATTSGSRAAGSGRMSGGTGQLASPTRPSRLWLVASTRSAGQARSNRAMSSPAASRTCSQLSTMSSASASRSCAATLSASAWPGSSRTDSAEAATAVTRSGLVTGASSMSQTPSG